MSVRVTPGASVRTVRASGSVAGPRGSGAAAAAEGPASAQESVARTTGSDRRGMLGVRGAYPRR